LFTILIYVCLNPGWGDSGRHLSRGAARREPLWRQPRDGRVPPPPATLMLLKPHCMRQGAINLSAPCSGYLSLRWTSAMAMYLLCACVGLMDGTSDSDTMNCTRCIGRLILLWLNPPELGLPLSCSYACYRSLLGVSALTVSQRCRDRGGSPNEARHGSPADRVWPSAPRPAPSHSSSSLSPSSSSSLAQSSHSPNSLPPLSSPFSCRLEWFDLSGTSLGFNPGPLGDLASASQSVPVAPPNSLAHSLPSRPMPCYTVLTLRVMAMKQAKVHNNGLTPALTLASTLNLNCKQALHCCKAWFLSYDGTWMIYGFTWRFWMGKQCNSCNCFQQCRMPTTPQLEKHMQQRLSHQSWHQLHHLGLRRKLHQSRRRTRHQSRRRTRHQSRRSQLLSGTRRSTTPPWTCGCTTTLPLDMHRCLFYFSRLEGRITVVLPHRRYSDNLCHLLFVSITVKLVTLRGLNFLLYVSRKVKL
jgi:hypothetical protein